MIQTWHRLETSLEFFTRPPPPLILLSEQSYFKQTPPSLPPPVLSDYQEQNYGYSDPWDEYVEQSDKPSKDSCRNYNNAVDNYLFSNDSSEINYSDHFTNFNIQFSSEHSVSRASVRPHLDHNSERNSHNNRDSHVQHLHTHSHSHNHHTPSQPHTSEPGLWEDSAQSDFSSVTDGGGNDQDHRTTSRKNSFSQPEQNQIVPEIRVAPPLVEHSYPHEPPAQPIHEPSQSDSSSVHCHTQQHCSPAQSDDEVSSHNCSLCKKHNTNLVLCIRVSKPVADYLKKYNDKIKWT